VLSNIGPAIANAGELGKAAGDAANKAGEAAGDAVNKATDSIKNLFGN
jgi:hypothetical protein